MNFFKNRKKGKYVRQTHGAVRGLAVAAAVILLLCGTAFAVWKAVVKPVEISAAPTEAEEAAGQPDAKPVRPPTVTVIEKKVDEQTGEETEVETEVPASHRKGVYNVLICGTDEDGYRTDTILIAHLDENTHETALLSVPRDTVVTGGSGIMKINSVYAGGEEDGMHRLEKRLETLLGFPVDGYVLVDLEAFQKTVDLLGGVWFDVPQTMHYEDSSQNLYIDLQPGYQLLNGYDAMCLCRFRKGYASQDIQRTKVQQNFVRAVAKQCMALRSLPKLKGLIEIAVEYVTTDLTVGNLLYFAKELTDCDLDAMRTYTVEGEGAMINGVSYYPLYDWSIVGIVNEAFNPYDGQIGYDNISVVTPELAYTYQIPEVTEDAVEAEEPETEEQSEEPEEPAEEAPCPPEEETDDFGEQWFEPVEPEKEPADIFG